MSKERQILQLYAEKHSQRSIASILGVSRNTVASVLAGLKRTGKAVPELIAMDDGKLAEVLFPEKAYEPVQVPPDFEKIHKELLRNGVTLKLLWEEYSDACREARKPAYKYSHFCQLYSNYVDQNRLTLHIKHKPGDKLMVDWAGTRLHMCVSPLSVFTYILRIRKGFLHLYLIIYHKAKTGSEPPLKTTLIL